MYRVHYPLSVLKRHGAEVRFIILEDGYLQGARKMQPEQFLGCNVVLLQRIHQPRLWEWLQPFKQLQGDVTFIYECDDNLFRLDPKNPAAWRKGADPRTRITPEKVHSVQRIVRACDALFVSTPELSEAWAHLHPRRFVLPNAIDFSFRDWDTPLPRSPDLEDKLVIGWAGGRHHIGDEVGLVGILPDILRRHPHVSLALCSNPLVSMHFVKRWGLGEEFRDVVGHGVRPLPEFVNRYTFLNPVPFREYPAVLTQFDIGLAPLEPTTFNRAKSELRLLEYGAHGIPYVAERIAPYQRFHEETNGLGGYLAGSKQEWRDGIERLVSDHEDRAVKSAAIKAIVRERYNYDEAGLRWGEALRAVRAGGGARWTPRARPGRNDPCACGSGRKNKHCCGR